MTHNFHGIVPVMITPFDDNNRIDWNGYARLIEWYIENGSHGLFAVCQSSEMLFLTLEERTQLAAFTVDQVKGRVPVVASGHISERMEDQKAELRAMAETGVDAVVLVTNRLAAADEDASVFRSRLQDLIGALPADITLGLYECPAPIGDC